MTRDVALSPEELRRAREVATVLLPGSSTASSAAGVPDLDDLLQHAAFALGGDDTDLAAAIEALPPEPSWDSLLAFAEADPESFGQVSLLAVGAYFMSPSVLASLGLPTGERRPANREQVVDELGSGILEPVFERGCPVRTLDDVAAATEAGRQGERGDLA